MIKIELKYQVFSYRIPFFHQLILNRPDLFQKDANAKAILLQSKPIALFTVYSPLDTMIYFLAKAENG